MFLLYAMEGNTEATTIRNIYGEDNKFNLSIITKKARV